MLELKPPYPPMEAQLVDELPCGPEWHYEHKWDGFRCIAFRDGDNISLQSKSCKPLERYFPDVVENLRRLEAKKFVIDGELVVPIGEDFSFSDLQMRLHPAASRVKKLSEEHPALMIAFDLLGDTNGKSLAELQLSERRIQLTRFANEAACPDCGIALSPVSASYDTAKQWLAEVGGTVDGVMAKRIDMPYQPGNRAGMQKVKLIRTVDCVVGGIRYLEKKPGVLGSLLLGLYDTDGLLYYLGFTSGFEGAEREDVLERIKPYFGESGFTGSSPGGQSRWSTERSAEWQPLRPELVIEVTYDHFTGGRFRHGTNMVRWRPDKDPKQCTMDQIVISSQGAAKLLLKK